MCCIFALINSNFYQQMDMKMIKDVFKKGKNRGPEFSKLVSSSNQQLILGFHRLAINGLNEESNQPLVFNGIELICNGEIYNYKNLYKSMNITPNTGSDCEVIIHLYLKYGIEQTLLMLDGVFAFVLYDRNEHLLFVARDPYGVRPLYSLKIDNGFNSVYGFASELKMMAPFYNLNKSRSHIKSHIQQFEPGTYSVYKLSDEEWVHSIINKTYFIPTFPFTRLTHDPTDLRQEILSNISNYLRAAVIKRCNTTERPVACLLSGGLDSSLIAALVADYFGKKGKQIETYSIGLVNSEDIKYAKIVADYIGSNHTEIIVTEKEMFDAIPEVIKAIESYDTTTVRASIGNYLIGKYIAANSEAKVIFNGDGSDEVFGGYLYMNKCPDDIEFDKETRRLLKDIHLFDVLRSDKSISSNGLEPRTPFLDRTFVNYILSIPPYFRNHNNLHECEKYLLRAAFNNTVWTEYSVWAKLLPDEIIWRKKEAFSDGVSSLGRSLFTILQEFIANQYNETNPVADKYEPSIELEKKYYKEIFDKEFPNCEHIIPYFWMPKYTNATDPSARTLCFYA
jgi:asparagine synthase (glutamine-hydrolysing)